MTYGCKCPAFCFGFSLKSNVPFRNLKAAQALGMETIRKHLIHVKGDKRSSFCWYHRVDVPLGGSVGAVQKLQEKLGIDLRTKTIERTKL